MIAPDVITQIERFLEQGELSHRRIAAQLGVSRGTVNAVASGQRAERNARRAAHHDDFEPPRGLPRRCPSCGRLVQMPCLACRLQSLAARRPSPSDNPRLPRSHH
jgi:hypothetical protein